MPDSLKPVAKAVAAFLAPIVLALVVKGLDAIGADLNVEVGAVETIITSILTTVAVYATSNKPA
jgi:hypothetical protein